MSALPTLPLFATAAPCAVDRARPLADDLNIPLVSVPPTGSLVLHLDEQGLALHKVGDPELPGGLRVDFDTPAARRRLHHPGKELLIQATKVRKIVSPLLIDATAGLGRDGFLLAAAGFRVMMIEGNPVVAALLADGLQRARQLSSLEAIAARIHLRIADALEVLPQLSEQPEVIYLDPMFPQRSKDAKVKQELRLLQLLDQQADSPELLLQTALTLRCRKVVVKRPLKGPLLAGLAPAYSLKGKAIRFDVYVGPGKEMPPP